MKKTSRFLSRTAIFLAILAVSVAAAGQNPANRNKKPAGPPGVFISKDGLRPDSPQIFSLYRGKVCVKKARFGIANQVAPGKYDLRVGFPSGWVSREIQVQAGKRHVVPTGLFRFENLTPPALKSTIPQKLYLGDRYLATGYQGMTARLFPGTYTVRYHAASDEIMTPVSLSFSACAKVSGPYS